jgi:hypothetical protein
MSTTEPRRVDPRPAGISELVGDVAKDLGTLLRQEVELAKVEAQDAGRRVAIGALLWAIAGMAVLFVLLFASLALWLAAAAQLGIIAAALSVALVWLIVGGVLLALGWPIFTSLRGLPQTAQTVSQIPHALNPSQETTS